MPRIRALALAQEVGNISRLAVVDSRFVSTRSVERFGHAAVNLRKYNIPMGLKFTAILGMFDVARHLVEKAPEVAERAVSSETGAHATAALAVAAIGAPSLLPLMIVGPAIVETAAKRFEGRPEPEALVKLFSESLQAALLDASLV